MSSTSIAQRIPCQTDTEVAGITAGNQKFDRSKMTEEELRKVREAVTKTLSPKFDYVPAIVRDNKKVLLDLEGLDLKVQGLQDRANQYRLLRRVS
jgi:hypothetical protein